MASILPVEAAAVQPQVIDIIAVGGKEDGLVVLIPSMNLMHRPADVLKWYYYWLLRL